MLFLFYILMFSNVWLKDLKGTKTTGSQHRGPFFWCNVLCTAPWPESSLCSSHLPWWVGEKHPGSLRDAMWESCRVGQVLCGDDCATFSSHGRWGGGAVREAAWWVWLLQLCYKVFQSWQCCHRCSMDAGNRDNPEGRWWPAGYQSQLPRVPWKWVCGGSHALWPYGVQAVPSWALSVPHVPQEFDRRDSGTLHGMSSHSKKPLTQKTAGKTWQMPLVLDNVCFEAGWLPGFAWLIFLIDLWCSLHPPVHGAVWDRFWLILIIYI